MDEDPQHPPAIPIHSADTDTVYLRIRVIWPGCPNRTVLRPLVLTRQAALLKEGAKQSCDEEIRTRVKVLS